MKNKTLNSLLVLFLIFFSSSFAAENTIPRSVQIAIKASDICYHWAGENGDQTPERNKVISKGVAQDCPEAKRKAKIAYKLFPSSPHLSLALLQLNDIGYFDLSDNEKQEVCDRGALLLKSGYFESMNKESFLEVLCPQRTSGESQK